MIRGDFFVLRLIAAHFRQLLSIEVRELMRASRDQTPVQSCGAIRTRVGKYLRYRSASRVSSRYPATAACAPM